MSEINTSDTPSPEPEKVPETHWERASLERLVMASLVEQRAARRWRNGIRLAWLFFLAALVWFGMERGTSNTDISRPHTAAPTAIPKRAATIEAATCGQANWEGVSNQPWVGNRPRGLKNKTVAIKI